MLHRPGTKLLAIIVQSQFPVGHDGAVREAIDAYIVQGWQYLIRRLGTLFKHLCTAGGMHSHRAAKAYAAVVLPIPFPGVLERASAFFQGSSRDYNMSNALLLRAFEYGCNVGSVARRAPIDAL